MPNGALSHQSFSDVWRAWEKRFVMERQRRGILTARWWRRPAGLPAHIRRWTMCQGNLIHTDQRLSSRPAVGGNGTERKEEEREKELITALMLHFIIVSWARLLTLTAGTWLSTQRPPLLVLAMPLLTSLHWAYHSVRLTGTPVA